MSSAGLTSLNSDFAKGGAVLHKSNSQFFKGPDQFRTDKGVEQDYSSKGGNKAKDKSLTPVKPKS